MVAPWIMVDELIYSELAKSFAAHGQLPRPRRPDARLRLRLPDPDRAGVPAFGSVPQAYAAAKAIDSVLMSLAAVPAYLLARRVVRPRLALVAAALTVAVPSMVYTGTLMTENAFYPLFLDLSRSLLVLVLERPTPLRVVALLALLAARVPRRARRRSRSRRRSSRAPLLLGRARAGASSGCCTASSLGAAALVLVCEVARGRSPLAVLGAYRGTTGVALLGSAASCAGSLYHVGELDLYVGVAPFAALLFSRSRRASGARRSSRRPRR